jgi:hypothetical protein
MVQTANSRLLGLGVFVMMLLFAAISTCAQTTPPSRTQLTPKSQTPTAPRTVRIEEPEEGTIHWLLPPVNLEVIKAFTARIAGASERYALTREPAELVVVIICLDAKKESLVEAEFCTYKFEFHSKKTPEFNMTLGTPSPVVGFRASDIADDIFEAFSTETSEMKLSVAELEAAVRVAEFCAKPANQVPCSGKLQ